LLGAGSGDFMLERQTRPCDADKVVTTPRQSPQCHFTEDTVVLNETASPVLRYHIVRCTEPVGVHASLRVFVRRCNDPNRNPAWQRQTRRTKSLYSRPWGKAFRRTSSLARCDEGSTNFLLVYLPLPLFRDRIKRMWAVNFNTPTCFPRDWPSAGWRCLPRQGVMRGKGSSSRGRCCTYTISFAAGFATVESCVWYAVKNTCGVRV